MGKDSANLDVLRASAALFVLFAHLLQFVGIEYVAGMSVRWLGTMGVFFFFVHTSLVLMMSLERSQPYYPGWRQFAAFYLRRAFRIYPLTMFVVGAIALLRIPSGIVDYRTIQGAPLTAGGVLSNLLLIQNLTLTQSILGPLWSLPIEIQMYVVLPFLFLFLPKLRSVWFAAGLWAAAIGAALLQPHVSWRLTFFAYVPDFLPGVLAYAMAKRMRPTLPSSLWVPFIAVLTVLYLQDPGLRSGWGICLVLGFFLPQFKEISNGAVRRAAHLVARYSFGLYLAHFFCLWLAFVRLGKLPAWEQWSVFVAAIILLPVILFHAIEGPGIRLGARLARDLFGPERQVRPVAAGAAG